MRTIPELFSEARGAVLKWPIVWLPAFMISALQLMAGAPYATQAAQGLVLLTTTLGAFVIEAGWLSMIQRALVEPPDPATALTFEDFKTGVNRYWTTLIWGNLAFYGTLGGLLALVVAYGNARYGFDKLVVWAEQVQALPPESMNAAMRPELLSAPIQGWMSLFALWMALATLFAFLLLFWQPVVVLRGASWPGGWLGSIRLVFGRFGAAAAIAVAHLVMLFASLTVLAAGPIPMIFLGLGMLQFVAIYFKVLYAALVADATRPAVDLKA